MATPDSVKEQERRADEAWQQHYGPQEPNTDEAAPDETAHDDAPVEEEPREAARDEQPKEADWQHRFNVLKGKYDSEVPRLSEQLRQARSEHDRIKQQASELQDKLEQAQANQPVDVTEHFSQEELDEFGEDSLRVIHRTARKMATDQAQQLREEMQGREQEAQKRQQQSSQEQFWSALEQAVPDWKSVDQQPAFHEWLAQPVPVMTEQGERNMPRQQLLETHRDSGNSRGVIELFNAYKGAKTAERDKPKPQREMPSRASSGADQGDPGGKDERITRQDIADFYREKIRWDKRDPEACRAREKEIERAVSQGRIVG